MSKIMPSILFNKTLFIAVMLLNGNDYQTFDKRHVVNLHLQVFPLHNYVLQKLIYIFSLLTNIPCI